MNTDWLHYFVILAETRNFHTAADKIGISPPTLSKAISDLENKYKTKLLNRSHKIQGLTPEGELFLENARNILAKINSLKDAMDGMKTGEPKGILKIAGGGLSLTYFVPLFLKKLHEQYPLIFCKTFSLSSEEVQEAVLEGKIDMGFTLNRPDDKGIDYKTLENLSFIIAGKPQPKKNWDQFSYIVFKFFEDPNISDADGWPARFRRKVRITTESMSMMASLCELGLGAAYLPQLAVIDKIREGLLAIVADPPFSHSREIYLIWPRNQARTVILSTALEMFFEIFPPKDSP
jgi:DNA-binding transcriptional LysR family regulator